MSRRPRRNQTPGFKAKLALAAIKGDKTLADLASSLTCTPTRSRNGRRSCRKALPTPPVDLKSLHGKIGELALRSYGEWASAATWNLPDAKILQRRTGQIS